MGRIKFFPQFAADGRKIVPIIRFVLSAAEVAAAHIHIRKVKGLFLRYTDGHAGQSRINLDSTGLGGRMKMEPGYLYIGEGG